MSNVAGFVIGAILAIYFVGTAAFGIYIQSQSKKENRDMFGEYPITQIVFHYLISLFLVLACFVNSVFGAFLGIGLALWVIKNLVGLCCVNEHKAFNNLRSASETEAFLNNIRSKVPVAQFTCKCSHTDTDTTKNSDGSESTTTNTVVTYTETRYVQILGVIDQTPALYVVGSSPLIYLNLKEQINWLGNSLAIINHMCAVMYEQNKFRDYDCDVTFSAHVPGLTSQNYLKRGEYPSWINQGLLWASSLLQFDVLYICLLRSRIPKTQLPVVKSCSIDPTFQINQPPQRLTIDQIQLPSFEQMCPAEINSIQLPPILEENTQPLLTDIKPPYFDNFDSISVPKYDAYSGDGLVQAEQQYTVEHGAVI
ncbi:Transmembrane_domain-containing protein [Hexamita inflata]|uniref:Transmembrane domain-containing protein n=1 Tax=Hexamita inflata TaxID=28002 RepID=A0AA86NFY9_9EUKA|nr:Transmembrane domain-containing protein [Hexamita inflata]